MYQQTSLLTYAGFGIDFASDMCVETVRIDSACGIDRNQCAFYSYHLPDGHRFASVVVCAALESGGYLADEVSGDIYPISSPIDGRPLSTNLPDLPVWGLWR